VTVLEFPDRAVVDVTATAVDALIAARLVEGWTAHRCRLPAEQLRRGMLVEPLDDVTGVTFWPCEQPPTTLVVSSVAVADRSVDVFYAAPTFGSVRFPIGHLVPVVVLTQEAQLWAP